LSKTHFSLSADSLALHSKKLLHLCKAIGGFLRLWGHDWHLSGVIDLVWPVLFADDFRLTESAVHAWGNARRHEGARLAGRLLSSSSYLPPHGASALPACLAVLSIHAVAFLNSHVGSLDMHLIEGVVTAENSDKLSEHASEGQNKSGIEASGQEEAPLDVSSTTVMTATASLVVTLSALASTVPVLALDAMSTLTLVAALLSIALSMHISTISSKVTTSLALVNLKELG